MFFLKKSCSFFIVFFFLFLLVLASCSKKAGREQEQDFASQSIHVEIINGTESVLYINNSFHFTSVGKFKGKNSDEIRNIYSINEMPSRSDYEDATKEISYMVLLPSQEITVLVPKEEVREPEDVALWVCRESLAKNGSSLPTMDEYMNLLLQSGGVDFSFYQQKYNTMRFKITDKWTMPVAEKAISDIEAFVKEDFYERWCMRDGIVYFDKY